MTTITNISKESPQIVTLTIGDPPFSSWTPGQFIRFSILDGTEWSEEHTFTVSSSPEEGEVRITVKAAGPFTSALQSIKPGCEVRIRGPFGTFCKHAAEKPLITLIAGGIGITPFLSVLRHLARTGTNSRICLFWANNISSDIIHRAELESISKKIDLRIVHTLWKDDDAVKSCRPVQGQSCHTGILDKDTLTKAADFPIPNSEIYLCGPPKMHEIVLEELSSIGIDPAVIHTESMG